MTDTTPPPPAGWYPDPQSAAQLRWWDGTAWSAHTRPVAVPAPAPEPAAPSAPPAAPGGYGVTPPAAPGYTTPGYTTPGYTTPGHTTPGYGAQGYGTAGYATGTSYPPGAYPPAAPPIGAWRSPVDDRPQVAGMGTAVRTVFTRYAAFEGRASRSEFWWWALLNAIIFVGLYIIVIVGAVGTAVSHNDSGVTVGVAGLAGMAYLAMVVWGLGTLLPSLAVTVRRLRDAGYPWALILLELVPFGGIAVLVLCAQPSRYP